MSRVQPIEFQHSQREAQASLSFIRWCPFSLSHKGVTAEDGQVSGGGIPQHQNCRHSRQPEARYGSYTSH